MAHPIFDYFARRAVEEEQLAVAAKVPIVRATHQRFAQFYRERLASGEMGVKAGGDSDAAMPPS